MGFGGGAISCTQLGSRSVSTSLAPLSCASAGVLFPRGPAGPFAELLLGRVRWLHPSRGSRGSGRAVLPAGTDDAFCFSQPMI